MIVLIIKIFLSTLFLSAGYEKFTKKEEHFAILKEYNILPKKFVRLFGSIEISIEILTGVMLLIGLFFNFFILISVFLLLTYSYAIAVNLIRGKKEISCGCGGIAGNHQISWVLILRNAFFILLCVVLYYQHAALGTLDAWIQGQSIKDTFPFEVFVIAFVFWSALGIFRFTRSLIAARNNMENLLTGGKE